MVPERLEFGKLPPQEATFRRRRQVATKEAPDNQEVFGVYRLKELVQKAILEDWRRLRLEHQGRKEQQQDILRAIWGKEVQIPFSISPSIVAFCLRWVGYEALGYPPAPPTPEGNLAMMIGSASHYSLLRAIERVIPGRQEVAFTLEDDNISGRIDFILKNPMTGEHQIVEIKTVSDYAFRLITREKLPPELRSTKDIFWPSIEHCKQVILYMWAKRKEGVKVACANIIYINREKGSIKEAIVPWDLASETDALALVEKIKEAKVLIDKGELPPPSVESPHVCRGFCPYRLKCEHGQKFAAEGVKADQRKRPPGFRQILRKQYDEKREKMEELGVVQAELVGFDGELAKQSKARPVKKTPEKSQPPACGDCGQPMVWERSAARGGRYVCSHCGNH